MRCAFSVLFLDNDFCVRSVLADTFDTVAAACLCLIALTGCDYLTVLSFQAEAELACLIGVHLKLGVLFCCKALCCLIFQRCDRCVVLYALYTVLAGIKAVIDLAVSDDLTVASLKVEHIAA